MVEDVPLVPTQVCVCVSPMSWVAISYHHEANEKSQSRDMGNAVSLFKSCQCFPKDDSSRCLCFPLQWCVTACMGMCVRLLSELESECVEVGHSCRYQTMFHRRLSFSREETYKDCLNLLCTVSWNMKATIEHGPYKWVVILPSVPSFLSDICSGSKAGFPGWPYLCGNLHRVLCIFNSCFR